MTTTDPQETDLGANDPAQALLAIDPGARQVDAYPFVATETLRQCPDALVDVLAGRYGEDDGTTKVHFSSGPDCRGWFWVMDRDTVTVTLELDMDEAVAVADFLFGG